MFSHELTDGTPPPSYAFEKTVLLPVMTQPDEERLAKAFNAPLVYGSRGMAPARSARGGVSA